MSFSLVNSGSVSVLLSSFVRSCSYYSNCHSKVFFPLSRDFPRFICFVEFLLSLRDSCQSISLSFSLESVCLVIRYCYNNFRIIVIFLYSSWECLAAFRRRQVVCLLSSMAIVFNPFLFWFVYS